MTEVTPKAEKLLAKLALGYSVSNACRAQGVSRQTYYRWREEDAEFADAADQAIEQGTDLLEDKARDRAAKTSDTLMIFLLKARRPDKFRDKQLFEHTGPNGSPLTIAFNARPDGPS